ncbi:hypothetical protein ART_1999 [Arthrobacter sp. PAMC 25486]|uniref:hypothetical protein n=1 Tax=Arthrobacter sp. PAMC 25486 TaxID=1494608 RepID=UPI000535E08A|nr:hypothetical protein [Arthrobacter sp. PAMC 25486]AIY01598.1 hypothetical protein ART_1999 [Arthrobacter sp. PAMC 25486]
MNSIFNIAPHIRFFHNNDANGGGSQHPVRGGAYVTTTAPRPRHAGSYVSTSAPVAARPGSYVTSSAQPSDAVGSYVRSVQRV